MTPAQRAAAAKKKSTPGPYGAQLDQLSREDKSARDIAARRQKDNVAYTAWQQQKQGQLGAAAGAADKNAARANFATQIATAMSSANTQKTLDAQRAGRANSVTSGPGNSRERLAGDDVLTQSLLANSQKRQNDAAISSHGKAGFLAAATAAAGQAGSSKIAGELTDQRKGIAGERRQVLNAREQAIAAAQQAQMEAEQAAQDRAQRAAEAQQALSARYDIAELNANSRASEGAANRAASLQRASISASRRGSSSSSRAKGASPSETRQRGDNVRKAKNAYGTLKSAASSVKSKGKSYSDAKAYILYQYPDLASDTAAFNAAMSAVYDPKSKGGKPRGLALKNYQNSLKSLRKGR